MEAICSIDNQKIKHIKKLLDDKKYRAESGQYVAEGARWVMDAMNVQPTPLFSNGLLCGVFVKESCAEKFSDLLKIAERAIGTDKVVAVADNVFDKTSATEHSQGVLAVLNKGSMRVGPESSFVLYLDRIRDPGNLGTMIRTAVAAGFLDIYLDHCADIYNPKAVRSSMSTLLKANCVEILNGETLMMLLKSDYKIIAADMGGENIFTNHEKFDKIILIIGSEANGIRPELLKLTDRIVSIPMQHVESLNAAVSAGILMYQLTHKKVHQ